MKDIEYKTIDRTGWDAGPWDSEPDKLQFTDEATGLPCLMNRNSLAGSWCGYVGVPEGHPYFGKEYDEVKLDGHGGVNFASFCQAGDESNNVCHIPDPGESDRIWWFGFDCNHGFDLAPGMIAFERAHGLPSFHEMLASRVFTPRYRDIDYVKDQCAKLAQQLKAAE